MPDYSSMSNEELFKMAGIQPKAAPTSSAPKVGYKNLSDAELFKMAGVAPKRERMPYEYAFPSFMTKYEEKPGERTLVGDIFERPGAAVRSAIMGKGYGAGAAMPEKVPMFQDMMLKKYYEKAGTGIPQQIGGLGVSAAGLLADMATNPADVLTTILPKAPGVKEATKAIANTSAGKAVGRFMTAERHLAKTAPQLEKEAVDIYRQVLRPTAGEVKSVEIKKRGSIRDPLTIAAEEKLPIGVAEEGGVKKIDTKVAREKVSARINELDDALTKKLNATQKTKPWVDLEDIRSQSKAEARKSTANDTIFKAMEKDIDEYIDDAINARGRNVSGADLNEIKRGMYSTGYNALKPTSDKAARTIGRVSKEAIEKAYKGKNIKQINDTMGKYLTLQKLLENSQGRVIAGGRIGKYLAQGIGLGVGAAAGSPIPYVGPIAGGLLGRQAGAAVYSSATNPMRLSKIAASKATKAGIVNRALEEALTGKARTMASTRRGLVQSPAGTNRLLALLAEKMTVDNRRKP